jgi:hypothetical protein
MDDLARSHHVLQPLGDIPASVARGDHGPLGLLTKVDAALDAGIIAR